ncbi:Rv3235 family protein [Microterricola pindariensis]|uniref:3-hydroxyacyl-CoA dehydrogenase n=1 Tax=Microterricola pindariensis TaxID=478010 RepID=A0ABX5B044_9MICO|nr:Rv3235 family protein [Microterricola pindariensis]PPL20165.1 hypothetical protein GY24_02280 [Microterricola pindariensis]
MPSELHRPAHAAAPADDAFARQRTGRAALPDPEPLLVNLTRSVLEILAGERDLEQIARWVTDEVYASLTTRVTIAARARAVKKIPVQRQSHHIARVIVSEPRDGAVEAVVIVHSRARSRAVAIRLEGLDQRWRASAISVL